MTLNLHVLPRNKGHYNMGEKYYLWSDLLYSTASWSSLTQ